EDADADLHADDAEVHGCSAQRADRGGEIRQTGAGEAAVGEVTNTTSRRGGPEGPPIAKEEHMGVKRTFVALLVAGAVAVIASPGLRAQAGAAAVTFKLGTFDQGGRTFVGLVLRDAQIVDIARANTAYEAANASAQKLTAPADMKQLIARYESEWRARLMAIARTVPATGAPAYVY